MNPAHDLSCKEHSGICIEIQHIKASDELQWQEIRAMKSNQTKILVTAVCALIGIVINLAMTLVFK